MLKRLLLLPIFLVAISCCYGQGDGCFNKNADGSLQLVSNIDLSNYNAFFVGEFHGVYGVSEIKLALIKHVADRYGVTDVFMEISYSSAWLYNQYLATGDTTLFITPLISYSQKQVNRDFWKDLYQYNNLHGHKITIHGMDFERMEFLKVLRLLMPLGKQMPDAIKPILTYIDTVTIPIANGDMRAKEHPGQWLNKIYDSIRTSIQEHKAAYSDYYGANYKVVEQVMFNENTFDKFTDRNRTMYDNMTEEIKTMKIKKFITFNGLNHGSMSYQVGNSLCHLLANTPPFKHKLVSIAMACKDCFDWQVTPAQQHLPYRGAHTYYKDNSLMNKLFDKHFNNACTYTLLPATRASDVRVSDFSDYIILMKDQPDF